MRTYKRKYRGLIKKAIAQRDAIRYKHIKENDKVRVSPDILDIDAIINKDPDGGYVGEAVRRRRVYKYLLNHLTIGKVKKVTGNEYRIKFKNSKDFPKHRDYAMLRKPMTLWKQQIRKI